MPARGVRSAIDALPPFRSFSQLAPDEEDARNELVALCIALLRALLQPSDAAQSTEAAAAAFKKLRAVQGRRSEIAFVETLLHGQGVVALDGVFAEYVPVATLLPSKLGRDIGGNLYRLFSDNRIISLTIPTDLSAQDFHYFVVYQDFDRVGVIRDRDMVSDSRALPWRVRLALTRLIQRPELIERAIQPLLAEPSYVQKFVLNLDLAAKAVPHTGGELPEKVLSGLPDAHLAALAEALLHKWRPPSDNMGGREALLSKLQPPIELRTTPARFLGKLDMIDDAEVYEDQMLVVLRAFPELLAESRFTDAQRVVEQIMRHRAPGGAFENRGQVLEGLLTDLDLYKISDSYVDVMVNGKKMARQYVMEVLLAMDHAAIPILMRLFDACERDDVCEDAATALATLASGDWVSGLLLRTEQSANAARYLIRVLGEIGEMKHATVLGGYLKHRSPVVRDAALETVFKLGGEKSKPILLKGFLDPSPDLVCKAIRLLERLGHRDDAYVKRLVALVEPPAAAEADGRVASPETVQVAAIEALSHMGDMALDEGTLEDHLLACVASPRRLSRPFSKGWRRQKGHDSVRVRLAICNALAVMGAETALDQLKDASTEPDRRVRVAMSRAAAEIGRRLESE